MRGNIRGPSGLLLACAVLLALSSVWPSVGRAQPAEARGARYEVNFEPQIRFDRLGLEEGLPQTHVLAVVQDESGFLWFGTQEGLARYDGYRMRVYRAGERGLTNSYITGLAAGAKGNVFVGTEIGLLLYTGATDAFTVIEADEDAPLAVTALIEDGEGGAWASFADSSVVRLQPDGTMGTRIEIADDEPELSTILALAPARDGGVWVGTEGAGLFLVRNDRAVERLDADDHGEVVGDGRVTALLATGERLWIGTEGFGLKRYDPASGEVETYRQRDGDPSSLTDDRVTALLTARDGQLWVGTKNGLARMLADGRFDSFYADMSNPQALAFPWVTTLIEDRSGVVWVGTFAGGLSYFDELRTSFQYYMSRATAVSAFLEEPESGALWIGTYPATLARVDRKKKRAVFWEVLQADGPEPLDISPYWLNQLYRDSKGQLWLSLYELGLVVFDPATEEYTLHDESPGSLGSSRIWSISEGPEGRIYAATFGNGLAVYSPLRDEWVRFTADNVPGMSDFIYDVKVDRTNPELLWLGSADESLIRLDLETESVTVFGTDDGISNSGVTSVAQSADGGSLWLGTYGGGLNHFDIASGKVEVFGAEQGLRNQTIYGVLLDAKGRVWMSTNGGGVAVMTPGEGQIAAYDASDGALSEYGQAAYHKGPSGHLFFGGPGGFVHFEPDAIRRDDYVPPLVFTGFEVFNKPRELAQPIWNLPDIDLAHGDSGISFQFAALAFASPKDNRYAYKLSGLHDEWIETADPSVTYPKLDPGDYVFRVRGANRHGVWNDEGIAISIAVAPPWYRTWWAYGVYGLMLAGALLAFVRYQTSRVERERQSSRLAAVERDLELTGAVQAGFLPQDYSVSTQALQLNAFYRPADMCSGDWWWYEQQRDGRHLVIVADVTGHGPGPAMVTAAVASACRTQRDISHSLDFAERLQLLNEEVTRAGQGVYQMTVTAMEIDESTGWYRIFSAGGQPPVKLDAAGKARVLPCRGTPLGTPAGGFMAGAEEGQLAPGDRILLYTDGVPEINMANGRQLGMRRFTKLWSETLGMPLPDVISQLVVAADQVRGDAAQDDDWTFVALEWGVSQDPAHRSVA